MIFITRPYIQGLHTKAKFKKLGMRAICYPLINIVPIISDPVHNQPDFNALIITSQNSIPAIKMHTPLKAMKTFVVGLKTADALRQIGFSNIIASCLNHEELIDEIKIQLPVGSKLLYLCGDHVACDFKQRLAPYYSVESFITYQSIARSIISPKVIQLFKHNAVIVLLYSSRSAKIFNLHFASVDLSNCLAMCISKNVAREIKNLNFKSIKVAAIPNENFMLAMVL